MSVSTARRPLRGEIAQCFARVAGAVRHAPLDVWLVLVIVAGFAALQATSLSAASTSYDEGVYWQSLRSLAHGNPLFSAVFSSQPPLFLLACMPVYLLAGQTFAAARLAILLYAVVSLLASWWIGRRLAGPLGGILACLLLACEPLFASEARLLEAEVPMLACELVGFALAVESLRHPATGWRRRVLVVLSGVACAAAIMIKLFAVVALIPLVLLIVAPALAPLAQGGWRQGVVWRQAAWRVVGELVALAGGVIWACLLVLLPFVNHLDLVYDQVIRFHLAAGTLEPYHWQTALRNVWSQEIGANLFREALVGVILLAVFLWLARGSAYGGYGARVWRAVPVFLWLALSFAVLVQQHPLMTHHYVILAPPLTLMLGLAVDDLLTGGMARPRDYRGLLAPGMWGGRLRVFAGIALVALALVTGVRNAQRSADNLRTAQALRPTSAQLAIARALQTAVAPGGLVITDNQYGAGLADRDVPPELVDTSLVRIQSGYLTAAQIEAIATREHVAAILISTERLADLPGFRAWVEAHYTLALQTDDGQALYVLAQTA